MLLKITYTRLILTQKCESQIRLRKNLVGLEVLTAASTKMAVFWVVALYSLVKVYRRFRGTCCLLQTTRRYNPEEATVNTL
jgi:hypothetical protein